jgi:integrase
MFTLGIKWKIPGFSSENPIADVRAAPEVYRERFLTTEETGLLIAAIGEEQDPMASAAILLILLTGARKREITNAKWEFVDLERRRLTVPLSKNGRARHIVLSEPAVNLLRSVPRIEGNPYLFPSPVTGRPFPTLNSQWYRVRERAGLQDVRLHDLRHSFASFLVNNGYSLYVVQALLGHTQAKTTQRYAHLAPKTLQDAADAVGDLLFLPPSAGADLIPADEGEVQTES